MNRFMDMMKSVRTTIQETQTEKANVQNLTAEEILNNLPYTLDLQTTLSKERVALWLDVLQPLEQLYLSLDEYTAEADLEDSHILHDAPAMQDLQRQMREIYELVKHDKYFSFILLGVAQLEEEQFNTFLYRYGKNSVKPCLYMIIRFEIECNQLLGMMKMTEKTIVEYKRKLLDDTLLMEYLESCRKGSRILIGLFDIGSSIVKHENQKTLGDWLADVQVERISDVGVQEKLDVLFGHTLIHRHELSSPSRYFLQAINPD